MSAAALGCLLLAAFFTLHLVTPAMPARVRALPWLAFGLALCLAAIELTRFDHGHADWSLWLGFVFAPVIVIFGGAAAGARRWYGWPDFGPIPGRLAAVAAALLLGVLIGTQIRASDVALSCERGEAIRRAVRAWRDAHGGRWPPTLSEASPSPPTTRMGALAPPPFVYDATKRSLRFPVGADLELGLDLASDTSAWARVQR